AQAESAKLDSRSAARAREIFRCGAPTAAAPGRMICALKGGDLTSSLVALREAHGVGRARAWLDRRISPVSVGCGRGARAERALEAKPAAVQQRGCSGDRPAGACWAAGCIAK